MKIRFFWKPWEATFLPFIHFLWVFGGPRVFSKIVPPTGRRPYWTIALSLRECARVFPWIWSCNPPFPVTYIYFRPFFWGGKHICPIYNERTNERSWGNFKGLILHAGSEFSPSLWRLCCDPISHLNHQLGFVEGVSVLVTIVSKCNICLVDKPHWSLFLKCLA